MSGIHGTYQSSCTFLQTLQQENNVIFGPRNLDLSKFCIGQKDDVQQPPIYDLYAVINHYGGMIGGHYTAYARLPSDKNSQRSDVGECLRECLFSYFLSLPRPAVSESAG